jgi:hypothetical protein
VDAEGDAWDEDKARPASVEGLHERLARLEERGVPKSELKAITADLEALEAKFAKSETH